MNRVRCILAELENKKIFLIASGNPDEVVQIEAGINAHFPNSTIFTAADGTEALFKAENVIPHVVIIDSEITKFNAIAVTEKLIHEKERIAVVILGKLPDNETFVNEVVSGQVHMFNRPLTDSALAQHLSRALNWIAHGENSNYKMRFMATGEILIHDGEKGETVFIVKRGKLKAYKFEGAQEVVLGYINPGEFVGEMAYINGEPRSANVESLSDCELVEIPNECLDIVLFSKPAWAKALVKTLSMRLKISNEEKQPS